MMSLPSAIQQAQPTGWARLHFELQSKIVACAVDAGLEQIYHQIGERYTMEAVIARDCYFRRDPLGSILLVDIAFITAAERPLLLAIQDIRPKAVEAEQEFYEHHVESHRLLGRRSCEQNSAALEKFQGFEVEEGDPREAEQ